MSRFAWTVLALLLVAAAAAAGVLVITSGDGGDRGEPAASGGTALTAAGPPPRSAPAHSRRGASADTARREVREAVAQSAAPRLDQSQRRIARTVRAYVAALDRHDGARACLLFAPGALSEVRLPRHLGDCGRSLSASIGYRDPRGFPVFAGARVARIPAVTIDGSEARVTATTVTRFADNREPSVEDDLIYLRRVKGRWLIAKPDAALYRAIGVGDIPPQALAPP